MRPSASSTLTSLTPSPADPPTDPPNHRSADVNMASIDGWTPLHFAADRGDDSGAAIVRSLLRAGAHPSLPNRAGQRPLHLAIDGGNTATIKLLLEYGAPVGEAAADSAGITPLHVAAKRSHLQAMAWLLQLGADPCAITSQTHKAPLHYAVTGAFTNATGDVRCVSMLLRAGASVNVADGLNHDTPLHVAVRIGSTDLVHTLLASGASTQTRNYDGDTPERLAIRYGRMPLAVRIHNEALIRRRYWLLRLVALVAAGRAELRPHVRNLEAWRRAGATTANVAQDDAASSTSAVPDAGGRPPRQIPPFPAPLARSKSSDDAFLGRSPVADASSPGGGARGGGGGGEEEEGAAAATAEE
jgi:ankyrin repeat protein